MQPKIILKGNLWEDNMDSWNPLETGELILEMDRLLDISGVWEQEPGQYQEQSGPDITTWMDWDPHAFIVFCQLFC